MYNNFAINNIIEILRSKNNLFFKFRWLMFNVIAPMVIAVFPNLWRMTKHLIFYTIFAKYSSKIKLYLSIYIFELYIWIIIIII